MPNNPIIDMCHPKSRILSLSVILLTGAFLLFPSFHARAADCEGVSGITCTCDLDLTCDGDTIAASSISITATNAVPFLSAFCSNGTPCLTKGPELCRRVARFLSPGNPGACKDRCLDSSANISNSVRGPSLCPGDQVCCLEASVAGGTTGCVNLAGYEGVCKPDGDLAENEISVSGNTANWANLVPPGVSCERCVVTLSNDLCKAAARHSMNNDVEMGVTVTEGADKWQCISDRNNCDKQGQDSTELRSPLFGNTNSQSPCPVGQYCCVPKEGTTGIQQAASAGTAKTLPDPLGGANIHSIVGGVIRTFAGIAGSIALIMFVYGGIMMILSRGEPGKVGDARKILVNSAIGIILIFAAYTFVAAIIDAILAE